jgi:hypothetical protein
MMQRKGFSNMWLH